ncbi:MAG: hypothetical protein DMG28_15430 [Acidobacteria bacterium]|nr:MAG: hypothetical protein DMG28_15430 [Acidobacteriota bacterium]
MFLPDGRREEGQVMTTVTFVAFAGVGVAFLIHVLVQFRRRAEQAADIPSGLVADPSQPANGVAPERNGILAMIAYPGVAGAKMRTVVPSQMNRKRRAVSMLLLGMVGLFLLAPAAFEVASQSPPLHRFSLPSGTLIDLPDDWAAREPVRLPPPPSLAASAPQVSFSEIVVVENAGTHSLLQVAVSNNPFMGRDAESLDAQMHVFAGSGNSLADYLFYFFFPPPRDCLDGGAEAYQKAQPKSHADEQTAPSPDLGIPLYCRYSPTLSDFYSNQVSAGAVYRPTEAGRVDGMFRPFYLAPMEEVESGGLTFYVFEAQGQVPLDQETINYFNLPDDLRGAQADFFWAVGAPTPFPFFRDPQRKNVPIIQVAYAGVSLGPNQRSEFMKLLHQVHSAPIVIQPATPDVVYVPAS